MNLKCLIPAAVIGFAFLVCTLLVPHPPSSSSSALPRWEYAKFEYHDMRKESYGGWTACYARVYCFTNGFNADGIEKTVTLSSNMVYSDAQVLNIYGQAGWDLVAEAPANRGSTSYLLKRPISGKVDDAVIEVEETAVQP
ncbi:MAG: hypothetical protein KGL39_03110 [Patescibacteria group bacterium]|nr:hypothetical protein [Patescibacteria group bacterium]